MPWYVHGSLSISFIIDQNQQYSDGMEGPHLLMTKHGRGFGAFVCHPKSEFSGGE
jgi:hypothetical protein